MFDYFRKESFVFIESLIDHYTIPLNEYELGYYIFNGMKMFLYAIFTFRMYSAISVLNKVKISFEEYSRLKRGLPLCVFFTCLCVSSVFQFIFFHDFAKNTSSTLGLSTTLLTRSADLQYSTSFLFESIYLGSNKIYDHQDVSQAFIQKIEKNEDKIFKTI